MASLKDINATIEEGNDDLEKLNKNFEKWFASQKSGGDDLEAAREKKRAVAVRAGDTFVTNNIKKGGGGSGMLKNLLTKAALAATVAAAIAVALKLLKDKGQDFLNDDSIIEGTSNKTVIGTGALVAGSIYGGFKGVKYGNRMGKALANAAYNAKLAKITAQNTKIVDGEFKNNKLRIASIENDANALKRKLAADAKATKLRLKLAGVTNATALGNTGREVRTNTPKSRFPQFNASNLNSRPGGTVTALNNARNSNIRIPTAANGGLTRSQIVANSNNKPRSGLNKFNSVIKGAVVNIGGSYTDRIKRIPSNIKTNMARIPPHPSGWQGTNDKYGKIVLAWLRGVSPPWAQKTFTLLMNPKVNIGLLTAFSILEIGAILADYQVNYAAQVGLAEDNTVPFLQKLPQARTKPEKAIAIAGYMASVAAFIFGARIGAKLGKSFIFPFGMIAGSILGGLLGVMTMHKIIEFIFDYMEGVSLKAWGERWAAAGYSKDYLDSLRGLKSISNGKTGGAMIRRQAPMMSLFEDGAFASGANSFSNQLRRGQQLGAPGQRDATASAAILASARRNFLPMVAPGPDRRRLEDSAFIQYGKNLNADGTLGALTFPSVSNSLSALSNQHGAGMIRRGSGEGPVIPVINSGNSSSQASVDIHMMPATTPHTVDTSITFINSIGPMSNLERARLR